MHTNYHCSPQGMWAGMKNTKSWLTQRTDMYSQENGSAPNKIERTLKDSSDKTTDEEQASEEEQAPEEKVSDKEQTSDDRASGGKKLVKPNKKKG